MKRSIPAASCGARASAHAFHTMVGKNGCSFRRNAPPPVEVRTVSPRPGVWSVNAAEERRPSEACVSTDRTYDVPYVRPVSVATWSSEGAAAAVHSVGAPTPYAIRDDTGSLVCHAIVALDGAIATARTSEISTGGGGAATVVVVVVVSGTVVVVVVSVGGSGLPAGVRVTEAAVDHGSIAKATALPVPAEAAADEAERVTRGSRWRRPGRGACVGVTGVGAYEARRIRSTGAKVSGGAALVRTAGAAATVGRAATWASP